MREAESHIDKDITPLKRESNDSDTDIAHCEEWNEMCREARRGVRNEISEYKLDIIQDFLFGGTCGNFGDAKVFVDPALIQVERFIYVWMTELSEESRQAILNYTMYFENDNRMRDYYEYLRTPVWKYISSMAKISANYTCAECGKQYHPICLAAHHKTYEHLGSELNHMDDLVVLCKNCHNRTHKRGGQNEQK